jgi:hypothetical protein
MPLQIRCALDFVPFSPFFFRHVAERIAHAPSVLHLAHTRGIFAQPPPPRRGPSLLPSAHLCAKFEFPNSETFFEP